MPESRQIGRLPAIERLQRLVAAPTHQWLIGPRRIGKTSVAKAVLARLRTEGVIALEVDLTKLGISTPQALAGEIARQAQAAGAGGQSIARRARQAARKKAPELKRLSATISDLGFNSEGEALDGVASLLASADDGGPGLNSVLEALALHARVTAKRVVVLFDEVHRLSKLAEAKRDTAIPSCQETVARWAREDDCPITFIFAGSEESAVRALRRAGKPLASVGIEFELPAISKEDWLHGLGMRFKEADIAIATRELRVLVDASEQHPRRTMLIASSVHTSAMGQPDRTATSTLVELAIADAQKSRAWK